MLDRAEVELCVKRLVGGAMGGQTHCSGWNRVHRMESNEDSMFVVSMCF